MRWPRLPRDEDPFWGSLIVRLRTETKTSQRHLCAMTGVPRTTLRAIEKGDTTPDVVTFEKLVNFFGYELDVFQRDPPFESVEKPR